MPDLEEVRTVTIDGRVVIPWMIQQALGLEHGGPVCFRVENGVVTLRAVDRRGARPTARPGDVRAALTSELKTLLEARERDRANPAVVL